MTLANWGDNPFKDWLEEEPLGRQAAFMSRVAAGLPPRQRAYLTNLFGQQEAGYLGQAGTQIRAGETPTLTWDDYLNRYFRPRNELMQAPLEQSGRGTARVAGPLRVLWNL